MVEKDSTSLASRIAAGSVSNGKPKVFVYDPKCDVKVTFVEDIKRSEVLQWLINHGIFKHAISALMYVRKKTYEIQLTSEEVVEKLASKVENDASVADFVKSKPLNTKVIFSLVPGNFPNNIVISRIQTNVGPVVKSLVEKEEDIPTGRRFYWVKTSDLERTPIPNRLSIHGRAMWVNYLNQPLFCFKCEKTGHVSADCQEEDKRSSNKTNEGAGNSKEQMIGAFEPKGLSSPPTDADRERNSKRPQSHSPSGFTPDSKMRPMTKLDFTHVDPTNINDLNWGRALDMRFAPSVVARRGASYKKCNVCNNDQNQGHTDEDLIIGRCMCTEKTRAHVYVKCCVPNCDEWFDFPRNNEERVLCKCKAINFICKCDVLHNVPRENVIDYCCSICGDKCDPPLTS